MPRRSSSSRATAIPVEAPLADVQACKDCIVAFQADGGFNTVMPNFAKNQQVKNLIEMKLK